MKWMFLKEDVWVSLNVSLKFAPRAPINSIGSDNGLAPTRRQVIIWTNDGKFIDAYMHHLGLNELTLANDTPYLTLMDELWDVYCAGFGENWSHNNGTHCISSSILLIS